MCCAETWTLQISHKVHLYTYSLNNNNNKSSGSSRSITNLLLYVVHEDICIGAFQNSYALFYQNVYVSDAKSITKGPCSPPQQQQQNVKRVVWSHTNATYWVEESAWWRMTRHLCPIGTPTSDKVHWRFVMGHKKSAHESLSTTFASRRRGRLDTKPTVLLSFCR